MCITLSNPPFCNCSNGYSGSTCDSFTCTRPCKNGGVCIAPNTCSCLGTGFLGPTCSGVPCGTNGFYCDNGGVCISPGVCNCSTAGGYYGPECNQFNCSIPCVHGTCVGINLCSCAGSGFTGPTCASPECVVACQNGGTCIGSNTCNCAGSSSFTGPTCSVSVSQSTGLNGTTELIIIVVVVGFVLGLAIIILAILLVRKRKQKKNHTDFQLQQQTQQTQQTIQQEEVKL